jgi:hypothetical protein
VETSTSHSRVCLHGLSLVTLATRHVLVPTKSPTLIQDMTLERGHKSRDNARARHGTRPGLRSQQRAACTGYRGRCRLPATSPHSERGECSLLSHTTPFRVSSIYDVSSLRGLAPMPRVHCCPPTRGPTPYLPAVEGNTHNTHSSSTVLRQTRLPRLSGSNLGRADGMTFSLFRIHRSREISVGKEVVLVRFEVFAAVTMKNGVFWDIETKFVLHRRHISSPLHSPSQLMLCKI